MNSYADGVTFILFSFPLIIISIASSQVDKMCFLSMRKVEEKNKNE